MFSLAEWQDQTHPFTLTKITAAPLVHVPADLTESNEVRRNSNKGFIMDSG